MLPVVSARLSLDSMNCDYIERCRRSFSPLTDIEEEEMSVDEVSKRKRGGECRGESVNEKCSGGVPPIAPLGMLNMSNLRLMAYKVTRRFQYLYRN